MVVGPLIALGLVPSAGGFYHLAQLLGGAEITAANARFFESPYSVVSHALSAGVYCTLGAFQFAPEFRRRRREWHRVAGRTVIPCGLYAGLSGLWMTLFYPVPEGDRGLLAILRLLFGTGMVLAIALGVLAVLRHDFVQHRAWMVRGYAIGLGAGTQVLIGFPWMVLFGAPQGLPRALMLGAGWAINIAVAEWIIRTARLSGPASQGYAPST